jgi:hypothetical protein
VGSVSCAGEHRQVYVISLLSKIIEPLDSSETTSKRGAGCLTREQHNAIYLRVMRCLVYVSVPPSVLRRSSGDVFWDPATALASRGKFRPIHRHRHGHSYSLALDSHSGENANEPAARIRPTKYRDFIKNLLSIYTIRDALGNYSLGYHALRTTIDLK